ncbi:MAG: cell division protein ZipA [Lysobacteraceae bacterium]
MTDVNLLRICIAGACVLLIVAIYFLGRPRKPDQGRRTSSPRRDESRREPTFGEQIENNSQHGDHDSPASDASQSELDLLERSLDAHGDGQHAPAAPTNPALGVRTDEQFDRIVTLYVAARAGQSLAGPDLLVAAEKAGLVHGHMSIFHRLVDGHPEQGPVFSVANMVKPGSFDLSRLQELSTPGISFFMTLPAPISALDAWDAMLPTAQRMAELLDALVLDEERNALGRQRIAHIRDELRAYDRQRDQQTIQPKW